MKWVDSGYVSIVEPAGDYFGRRHCFWLSEVIDVWLNEHYLQIAFNRIHFDGPTKTTICICFQSINDAAEAAAEIRECIRTWGDKQKEGE